MQHGVIYARVTIDGEQGNPHGRITGGTGAYHGARGTVTGKPGKRPSDTKLTIVYQK